MKLTVSLCALICAIFSVNSINAQEINGEQVITTDTPTENVAVINFTANLSPEGYSGNQNLNPYVKGTLVNQLINGTFPGFPGSESEDWIKCNGQIVIPNFKGDGTYVANPAGDGNGGAAIYLHSPIMNRIEAVSLRTEAGLSQESLDLGAGRLDGNPTQNRDDIYLPDYTPNGIATVTITGNNVSIDYDLDFSNLPLSNALFLRDGDTQTDISEVLLLECSVFEFVGVDGDRTASVTTATIGKDDDTIPYGAFYTFDSIVGGNLANTIVDLNRGILRNEIAAMNISSDGRSATNPDTVFLTDIFVNESGTVTFYNLNDGPELDLTLQISQPVTPGDVDGNGVVDLLDVAPFIDQLIGEPTTLAADVNKDGFVDLLDVAPFVDLLASP